MNKAELIQIVGWRLGDRADMAARIDLELDTIQDNVLESNVFRPWFLESELAKVTTTANERRVPLPEDFLSEIEESHLYVQSPEAVGTFVEMLKKDPDTAARLFPESGFPVVYAISGLYFQMFPLPLGAYPLQMRYFAKASRISDETTVSPWLQFASDLVLAELCQVLAAKHIKDAAAAQGFAADASAAWKKLYDVHTARGEINVKRSLGDNS